MEDCWVGLGEGPSPLGDPEMSRTLSIDNLFDFNFPLSGKLKCGKQILMWVNSMEHIITIAEIDEVGQKEGSPERLRNVIPIIIQNICKS